MKIDLDLKYAIQKPLRTDACIGIIGAGFIVRDIQLIAYRNASYNVGAIASRSYEVAQDVASVRGIPKVFERDEELLAHSTLRLDIAVPPDQQLRIVRAAVRHNDHIKGILCQKPLATNYSDACEIVRLCDAAGITLGSQSEYALRSIHSSIEDGARSRLSWRTCPGDYRDEGGSALADLASRLRPPHAA